MRFVFKTSYDKANRTSVNGKRGMGIAAGLAALAEVKDFRDSALYDPDTPHVLRPKVKA